MCVFLPQQAFNATAVVRHMRRLQLGTGHEGPNPNLPAHLLMPEEDAGTRSALRAFIETVNATADKMRRVLIVGLLWSPTGCCEGGCSQNIDAGADPMSNCSYRCHQTGRV